MVDRISCLVIPDVRNTQSVPIQVALSLDVLERTNNRREISAQCCTKRIQTVGCKVDLSFGRAYARCDLRKQLAQSLRPLSADDRRRDAGGDDPEVSLQSSLYGVVKRKSYGSSWDGSSGYASLVVTRYRNGGLKDAVAYSRGRLLRTHGTGGQHTAARCRQLYSLTHLSICSCLLR